MRAKAISWRQSIRGSDRSSGRRRQQRSVAVQSGLLERVEPRQLLANVAGIIFNDANSNGRRDPGESGAAGQTVWADYDYNGAINAGEPTAKSGVDGSYVLNASLRSFALRMKPTAGVAQSAPASGGPQFFVVKGGQLYGTGTTFGVKSSIATSVSITGAVYNDADADGRRDNGETGVAGRTVFADLNYNGLLEATEPRAVTDANGNYALTVPKTNFALRLLAVSGSTQTGPRNNGVYFYEVHAGTLVGFGTDFGALAPAPLGKVYVSLTIKGLNVAGKGTNIYHRAFEGDYFAWVDVNCNNVRDANEPILPRVPDFDGQNVRSIGDLPAGNSSIAVGTSSAVGAVAVTSQMVTSTPAQPSASTVFELLPTTPVVSGMLFEDSNANGQRDPGEPLLNGARDNAFAGFGSVFADYNGNGVLDANDTPAFTWADTALDNDPELDGFYVLRLFPNTPVSIMSQAFKYIYPDDSHPMGRTTSIPRAAYDARHGVYTADLGFVSTPTMSGSVFGDANRNGFREAGENGLAGRRVFADYNYNGVVDAGEVAAVTDTSGDFFFAPERRNFALRLIDVSGSTQTAPAGGEAFYYEYRNGAFSGPRALFGVASIA